MKKLSLSDMLSLKTTRQFTCEKVSELSGLPLDVVNGMYPSLSNKFHGDLNDAQIIEYYENILNQTNLKSKTQSELENILFNYEVNDLITEQGRNDFLEKFEMLENSASQLEIVKQTIIKATDIDNNPKYKTVLKPLYESLQINLTNVAHVSKYQQYGNLYSTIMDNLNRVVVDKQLHDKMVSDDNAFYSSILQTITSGVGESFYTEINNIDHLITDKQSLLIDLIAFVNVYFESKEIDLKYVSTKTFNEYQSYTNQLLNMCLSSIYDARTLKVNVNKELKISTVKQLSSFIDYEIYDQLNINLATVSPKAINDSLNLIFSMKHLFAIPIRKNISLFTTKAKQLLSDVNNARIARNMAGF